MYILSHQGLDVNSVEEKMNILLFFERRLVQPGTLSSPFLVHSQVEGKSPIGEIHPVHSVSARSEYEGICLITFLIWRRGPVVRFLAVSNDSKKDRSLPDLHLQSVQSMSI